MTDNTASPYTVPLGWLPADDHAVVADALDVVWVRQSDGMWRHGPSGTVYTIDELWEETDRHPFTRLLAKAEWEAKRPQLSDARITAQMWDTFSNSYARLEIDLMVEFARAVIALASTPEGSKP